MLKKMSEFSKSKIFKLLFSISPLKIGVFICFICVFMLIRHYSLPKGSIDLVGQLERELYDLRFKLRGAKHMSGVVGVLTADDKSVETFGRWPFPRHIYEKAFLNLKNAGVQWLGFDVFFSEPARRYLDESIIDLQEIFLQKDSDKNLFEQKIQFLLSNSPGDLSLGKTIEKFENVVQGFYFIESIENIIGSKYNWLASFDRLKKSAIDFVDLPKNKKLDDYPDLISAGAVTNTQLIAGQAKFMGFANNQSDSDGLIRKATLVKAIAATDPTGKTVGSPILLPSLALSLAANYTKSGIIIHLDSSGIDGIELFPSDGKSESVKIPLYYDGLGKVLINHYGGFYNVPQLSLHDAYENKLPKDLPKILIYGGTATGTNDKRPSPFDENFDGVGHHATIIENILKQDFMSRPLSAPIIEVSILLFSGFVFSTALRKMNALKSAIFIFTILILFFLFDKEFLFENGNWYYSGMFYLQSFSMYFGITIFKYFTEEREKKKVKSAFQYYLNPAVINQLMEHPERLKLGGDKKNLTVFFSDVRGFTTISESLSPEKLTALLNEYFTPMTEIILESNGLLDKYIGDAIMAVWGAPIPLEDHADRALISSLKMLDVLENLQKKWASEGLPFLDIGIGLNTGDMVVGNMGSNQRFDYTVLGDAVNLGARLEGINKNYGTRIICSEFTKNNLKNPDKFVLRELDKIQVKGKNEPVCIFEVMHFPLDKKDMTLKLVKTYEEALALYRKQLWNDAVKKFNEVLTINNEDLPSKEFIERCHYLQKQNLDKNWNGVWVFKTK